MRLESSQSFDATLSRALDRINSLVKSKLNEFFEDPEYDWTTGTRENSPSMYLLTLINWLTTVLDTLAIKESYKDEVYKASVTYITECLMVWQMLTSGNPMQTLTCSDCSNSSSAMTFP